MAKRLHLVSIKFDNWNVVQICRHCSLTNELILSVTNAHNTCEYNYWLWQLKPKLPNPQIKVTAKYSKNSNCTFSSLYSNWGVFVVCVLLSWHIMVYNGKLAWLKKQLWITHVLLAICECILVELVIWCTSWHLYDRRECFLANGLYMGSQWTRKCFLVHQFPVTWYLVGSIIMYIHASSLCYVYFVCVHVMICMLHYGVETDR